MVRYVSAMLNTPMKAIDGKEVLSVLFKTYDSVREFDGNDIVSAYERLYETINHKPINEITEIEISLHELVMEYEKRGFKEGVKVGLLLANELKSL